MPVHHRNGKRYVNLGSELFYAGMRTLNGLPEEAPRKPKKGFSFPRGSANPASKLSDENVKEIRALLQQGVLQKDIAIRFNVSPSQISHISTKRDRKHWGFKG